MSEPSEEPTPFGVPIAITPEALAEMRASHDRSHAKSEERYVSMMRWLTNQDGEGLMALRYVLQCDPEDAYANSMRYDGMIVMLMHQRGINPRTGRTFSEELLGEQQNEQ